MLEGMRYKIGKNRVWLIPEMHMINIWSEILARPEKMKDEARFAELLYAHRKRTIDEINPDALLLEYPIKQQKDAEDYNAGKISAEELMERLATPAGVERESTPYEKKLGEIRKRESGMFKGRKICLYDWNKDRKKTVIAYTTLARKAQALLGVGPQGALLIPNRTYTQKEAAKEYIREYEKYEKMNAEREKEMAGNIKKITVRLKDKRTAAICGASHYSALARALEARATKDAGWLYSACLNASASFGAGEETKTKAYQRALRIVKTK